MADDPLQGLALRDQKHLVAGNIPRRLKKTAIAVTIPIVDALAGEGGQCAIEARSGRGRKSPYGLGSERARAMPVEGVDSCGAFWLWA
ncbi:MAG: hypothetical protein QOD48_2405 [Gaiellaceae bacterium]|jgi:hypothetical protein|nr:hypothetical protein [Gaiellaceae bacterium]